MILVHSESIIDELDSVNPYKEHQGAFHASEKAAKKAKEAPLILNSMRFKQAIKNETGGYIHTEEKRTRLALDR